MKKFMFMALAAIAAFSSCSNEEEMAPVAQSNDVVSFGAYNLGQSRSKIETIESIKDNGFGVFAFSTMETDIEQYIKSDFMPNFMYNQKVSFDATQWIYSPVKYWPNNPGAKVSFYAYAPYFSEFSADVNTQTPETNEYLNVVNPIEKKNVRLILGYDYNGPGIEYTPSTNPLEGVDLMWGEYIQGKGQAGTVAGSGKDSGAAGTATGKAAVNVDKQKVDESVFFQFHHALSRVNFNIQVWADKTPGATADAYHTAPGTSNGTELAAGTTIKIRKVELVGKIPTKGTLRLYDGSWNVEKDAVADVVLTEENFSDAVKAGLTTDDAAKEIDLLTGTGFAGLTTDDTKTDLNVNNYLMLIPGFLKAGTPFSIRITYDVITEDPANPKNSSTVTNVVSTLDPNALFGPDAAQTGDAKGLYTLEQGKAYNFHLNIGMTSVKFSADVDQWDVLDPEVVLPKND